MSTLFRVPARALTAWLDLHEQITEAGGTPCAGPNRDDWTGTQAEQARAANACLDCPVMQACGTYADTAGEQLGVWGGITQADRKRAAAKPPARKRRARKAPARKATARGKGRA